MLRLTATVRSVLWAMAATSSLATAVGAVTKDDVLRIAKKYIDVERLAIVVVGDRASIEAPIKATGIAPITYLDIEGSPKTP